MKEFFALASNLMLSYRDDDDVFIGGAELVILSRRTEYRFRDDGTTAVGHETFQDRLFVTGKQVRGMINGLQKIEREVELMENRVTIEKSPDDPDV